MEPLSPIAIKRWIMTKRKKAETVDHEQGSSSGNAATAIETNGHGELKTKAPRNVVYLLVATDLRQGIPTILAVNKTRGRIRKDYNAIKVVTQQFYADPYIVKGKAIALDEL